MSRHDDYKCMSHIEWKDSEGQCQGDYPQRKAILKSPRANIKCLRDYKKIWGLGKQRRKAFKLQN